MDVKLGEGPIWDMKLLLSKGGSNLRGEVGLSSRWVGWCVETGGVGTKLRPETSSSVGMCGSWWEERCLYF